MEITIRSARPADAQFIARGIMTAIGYEICSDLAQKEGLDKLEQVFATLASRLNTQYSYANALIAQTVSGEPVGVVIAYDGALLQPLRRAFIDEANRVLQLSLTDENVTDETDPGEIYIDTLMVIPEMRRKGIASQLLKAIIERYADTAKPIGLLVDYVNPNARRLYAAAGFRKVGERPFLGTLMEHMQHP